MTLTAGAVTGFFSASDDGKNAYERFSRAIDGALGARQQSMRDEPDFVVEASTTTNDTGVVINLSTEGVTFPADTFRMVTVRAWAKGNGDENFYKEIVTGVEGGSTPDAWETAVIADLDGDFDADISVDVSSNEVRVNVTGVVSQPANWRIEAFVSPLKPLVAASS